MQTNLPEEIKKNIEDFDTAVDFLELGLPKQSFIAFSELWKELKSQIKNLAKEETPASTEGGWIDIKNKPVQLEGAEDMLVLFKDGQWRRLMEEDLPVEIITHYMIIPSANGSSLPANPVKQQEEVIEALKLCRPYIEDLQRENFSEPGAGISYDYNLERAIKVLYKVLELDPNEFYQQTASLPTISEAAKEEELWTEFLNKAYELKWFVDCEDVEKMDILTAELKAKYHLSLKSSQESLTQK